jgi:hypothetical protein
MHMPTRMIATSPSTLHAPMCMFVCACVHVCVDIPACMHIRFNKQPRAIKIISFYIHVHTYRSKVCSEAICIAQTLTLTSQQFLQHTAWPACYRCGCIRWIQCSYDGQVSLICVFSSSPSCVCTTLCLLCLHTDNEHGTCMYACVSMSAHTMDSMQL